MKQRTTLVLCLLIACLTLLIFTYLTRSSLCELRIRDGNREVAAFLAYESGKYLTGGGVRTAISGTGCVWHYGY